MTGGGMTREALHARGERLRAFVAAVHGVQADWDGCSTWPAAWVAAETGREVEWPSYADEAEGRAVIERAGGLVALWTKYAARAGLERIHDGMPGVGDIGIIETSTVQVGGIFTFGGGICVRSRDGASITGVVGRSYAVRRANGVVDRIPLVAAAWRVPSCA